MQTNKTEETSLIATYSHHQEHHYCHGDIDDYAVRPAELFGINTQ